MGGNVAKNVALIDENFEPVAPDENVESTMTRPLKLRAPDGTEKEVTLHAVLANPPEATAPALSRVTLVLGFETIIEQQSLYGSIEVS